MRPASSRPATSSWAPRLPGSRSRTTCLSSRSTRAASAVVVFAAMRRLLVANRGEIALRIFRACRDEGVSTVAVVAPDDKGSLHARSADDTVEIASYLDAAEHVRAAQESNADAVHPGYGFLAESPEFADPVLA